MLSILVSRYGSVYWGLMLSGFLCTEWDFLILVEELQTSLSVIFSGILALLRMHHLDFFGSSMSFLWRDFLWFIVMRVCIWYVAFLRSFRVSDHLASAYFVLWRRE